MEVLGGGAFAATIMEFWTMEGYAVGFLIGVVVFEVRSITGGEKVSGELLPDGSKELEDSSL